LYVNCTLETAVVKYTMLYEQFMDKQY